MSSTETKTRVGIFAASSAVPMFEFERGVQHLREHGFEPVVHAQVSKQHFTFAGTDEERAAAIYGYATDPTIPVLWAARGGYGAGRLLPVLEDLRRRHGTPPRKLLVGYSDVTVLHEYVRQMWGWSMLHAPMPAASDFSSLEKREFAAIVDYVKGSRADAPWEHVRLSWLTEPPARAVEGELIGGNLSLWQTLAGTYYEPSAVDKILFFEDLGEAYYRLDRMITHLDNAFMFQDARAIVLGDFCDCKDEENQCWANPAGTAKKSLRRTFNEREAFDEIFGRIGRKLRIPIAYGLPVGHGPHFAPLPLGARYTLTTDGQLSLTSWDWLRS